MTTRREFLGAAAAVAVAGGSGFVAAASDAEFVSTTNDYIAKFLENSPETSTNMGEHRYDGRLSDLSATGRARTLAMHQDFLKRIGAIDPSKLRLQNRVDYEIVRLRTEAAVWNQTVLREMEWDPMQYNPGNALYLLLEREFAPLPERLESLRMRLDAMPEYLQIARASIGRPPRIFTETAITQNKGTLSLVRDTTSAQAAKVPGMKQKLARSQERAAAALEDWGAYLQMEVLPRSDRDFRLGSERFEAKLRFTLDSQFTAAQILEKAQAELEKTQDAMYETAAALAKKWLPAADVSDRKKTVRMVLNRLAEQRPTGADVITKAEKGVREATAFVNKRALVTVPTTPLQVVPMPEFKRGQTVASCSAPGPLEKRGQTFLNISPPLEGWNAEQEESFYREYNDAMLLDLVVHEGMPGHYLQIAHSNHFMAPTKVRAVFPSGPFSEGWAVYAERVMADQGFGGPEVRMQQLKMWMRSVINALLDVRIHTGGMTEQQAMDLMMDQGYQERSEAAGKWRRANLSSTQLSTYFVGATELFEFRESYARRHGTIRDWKAFHDRMLSFGSPAPRYLQELMA